MSPKQTISLGDTLLQLLFHFIFNTAYGAYLPHSYVGSDGLLSGECVQCLIWLFSVVPKLHGFLSWYVAHFLNDFEMVPVSPIITGITVVFTFHIH